MVEPAEETPVEDGRWAGRGDPQRGDERLSEGRRYDAAGGQDREGDYGSIGLRYWLAIAAPVIAHISRATPAQSGVVIEAELRRTQDEVAAVEGALSAVASEHKALRKSLRRLGAEEQELEIEMVENPLPAENAPQQLLDSMPASDFEPEPEHPVAVELAAAEEPAYVEQPVSAEQRANKQGETKQLEPDGTGSAQSSPLFEAATAGALVVVKRLLAGGASSHSVRSPPNCLDKGLPVRIWRRGPGPGRGALIKTNPTELLRLWTWTAGAPATRPTSAALQPQAPRPTIAARAPERPRCWRPAETVGPRWLPCC